jgi:hypothetical protein
MVRERRDPMLGGAETTDDPVVADTRDFYKVELWAHDADPNRGQ